MKREEIELAMQVIAAIITIGAVLTLWIRHQNNKAKK